MAAKKKATTTKKRTTKKQQSVPVRTQLLVATMSVLLLFTLGLVVYWLDARADMTPTATAASYADITIQGKATCLPVKDSVEATPGVCPLGVRTESDAVYAIEGSFKHETDDTVSVTGTLEPALDDTIYNYDGLIKVD